jgi:hypothetical protein
VPVEPGSPARDTVDIVRPALYPQLPFVSSAEGRQLDLAPSREPDAIDRALDLVASGASLVGLLLPSTDLPPEGVDEEVAAVMADVARRALEREATWVGKQQLTARDIGVIDPHVASGAAVRRALRARGIPSGTVSVDTAEIWQGQERPLMIVKHPLSGVQQLSPFSLEPGRWCVMLSRHQLGCIVVGREGIDTALTDDQHNCADRPMGGDNTEWAGWRAHWFVWRRLERLGRLVRVGIV